MVRTWCSVALMQLRGVTQDSKSKVLADVTRVRPQQYEQEAIELEGTNKTKSKQSRFMTRQFTNLLKNTRLPSGFRLQAERALNQVGDGQPLMMRPGGDAYSTPILREWHLMSATNYKHMNRQ